MFSRYLAPALPRLAKKEVKQDSKGEGGVLKPQSGKNIRFGVGPTFLVSDIKRRQFRPSPTPGIIRGDQETGR
jgi:hypothetical protein